MLVIPFDVFAIGLFVLWLMLFNIIPMGVTLSYAAYNFVFRTNYIAPSVYGLMLGEECWKEGYRDCDNAFWLWVFTLFGGAILVGALLFVLYSIQLGYGANAKMSDVNIDLMWFLILGIPHTARWVVDVTRNFKLNRKTGDSERIAQIEAELRELRKGK